MENSFGMETLFCIRRNERALKSEPIKIEKSKILRKYYDFKFTLANQILVLFPPLGSYVFVDKGKRKPTTNIKKNKLI